MSAAPVLSVEGLSKSFGGVVAAENISFEVGAGELLAIIGPNGAGKSTLFNMINGQLAPDSGMVRLLDRPIAGSPPRRIARLGVSRTFQITATFLSMRVIENVQMALISCRRRTRGLFASARDLYRDEALFVLERVGMAAQAERPCAELAYGDIKRVELAIALASDPILLLMDEPTAGMAPGERARLMRLVAEIAREHAIAVLFTEHDMDVVFAHADRILVLVRGQVLAQGLPEDVRADAEVQRVYLGSHGQDAAEQAGMRSGAPA